MKSLITGVAGFLGSNLVPLLLERGHEVVGIDNLSHGFERNLAPFADHPRFHWINGDVRDPAVFDETAPDADVIVHLAAEKIPRYGTALKTLDTNLTGARNVLEACRRRGARAVLASTSDVYGMSTDLPFREDGNLVLGPSNVRRWAYAVSKLADEHLAMAFHEEYGTEVVMLRFFGAYGENQNVTWWGGPQSVFIGRCLRNEPLEIHGDGLQTRSFTYVGDTVRGIFAAVHEPAAVGRAINIGNDREICVLDLGSMIWEMVRPGTTPRFEHIPYSTFGRYQDVRRRVPDRTLARELLGFDADVSLEEALPRTIRWQAATEGLVRPGDPRTR